VPSFFLRSSGNSSLSPQKNYSLIPCEEKYGVVSWEFPLVIFWVTAKSAFTCL